MSNGCATSLRCAKLLQNQLAGNKREDGSYKLAAEVLQPLYAIGTDKLPSKASFPEIWDTDAG